MKIIRRKFLCLFGITVAVPAMSKFALAQAQSLEFRRNRWADNQITRLPAADQTADRLRSLRRRGAVLELRDACARERRCQARIRLR